MNSFEPYKRESLRAGNPIDLCPTNVSTSSEASGGASSVTETEDNDGGNRD